jgi:ribonuclease BN (tRNA processing enzyme)
MKLRFIGCGDAFGSGGRFNTCFLVERGDASLLIDCGASSMIAMRQRGVDPNRIRTIFISHLHGDHFGGLPFLILDAQFYSRRRAPLTLVGPPGFTARLRQAMELFFPGSADAARKFEVVVREIAPGTTTVIDDVSVRAVEVRHACGAPALALRLDCDGRTIAYSGDSEWTDALIEIGRDADLFIVEALSFDKRISQHLDYAALLANEARIGARRIILTHLGPEMLSRMAEARHEIASDGLVVEV